MDLPELTEGVLDEATVETLFADLAACTTGQEVRVRRRLRRQEQGTVGLDEAQALLACGEAAAVQVRYWWKGESWIDTVIRRPDGYHVTRMQVPRRPAE